MAHFTFYLYITMYYVGDLVSTYARM